MAGARDTEELVVAVAGDVYVAPVGTAAPTTATDALNASFYKLGYVSEDGVTFSTAPTIEEFLAWQQRQPVRREATGSEQNLTFGVLQWNAETVKLAFGGGQVAEISPGEFRYDFPSDDDALDERAIVVDWQDGDEDHRLYFQRGSVTEAVETQLTRGALAVLPITFSVLAPSAGGSPGSYWTSSADFHS